MKCLDCDSDLPDNGYGFITCSECGSRHKNHALTGLTLQPLNHVKINNAKDYDESFVKDGNKVKLVKTLKPARLSYGAQSDPVFIGSHCAGCGVVLTTLTANTVRADCGSSLIHIPYTYQEHDTDEPVILFNRIVVQRETTCWVCDSCGL